MSRILIVEDNRPPYTIEQLLKPYVGTALEQADRAAGGPELRRKIIEEAKIHFVDTHVSDIVLDVPAPAPLALVPSDSPILRQRCREVRQDELFDMKDPGFLYRIDKFRRQLKGVGLAAPQIGDSRAYFCWAPRDAKAKGGLVINPRVTFRLGQTEGREEGCLSFPGRRVVVDRPVEIGVEYTDEGGNFRQRHLHYLEARIFLHEFDHLQGICIL